MVKCLHHWRFVSPLSRVVMHVCLTHKHVVKCCVYRLSKGDCIIQYMYLYLKETTKYM